MAPELRISPTVAAIRFIVILFAAVRVLHGQGEEPAWDPHESGGLTLGWLTTLLGILAALGFCGLWRLFIWFLESKRSRINWRADRYWWPTAMLVWTWMMAVLDAGGGSGGVVFDAILLIYALVNLPGLIVVVPVLDLCGRLAAWPRWIAGSIGMWATSYVIVHLAEWRAWINTPISLHIGDKEAGTSRLS
jgi:hypothetical protein